VNIFVRRDKTLPRDFGFRQQQSVEYIPCPTYFQRYFDKWKQRTMTIIPVLIFDWSLQFI